MSTDYDYERNLTKQSFVLDVYQRKMIALLIAHVSPDDEEFRMEKISFANFVKLMNIPKGGKTTELIHSSIAKLMGMSFCIEVKPRVYEYYHWIAGGCRVDEEERAIYIQLSNHRLLPRQILNCPVCKLGGVLYGSPEMVPPGGESGSDECRF